MRIRQIRIDAWRHFENIALDVEEDAPLVCIVGANGTGKSHLLELIAACAHKLGLSPGIEIPRGDPFADAHEFYLQYYLAHGASEAIERLVSSDPSFSSWDRTLAIQSTRSAAGGHAITVEAGGVGDATRRAAIASLITNELRRSESVHFLSLDADRAYPKKNVSVNEIAQAYEIDWAGLEYTRGRSFKTTTTLYDEWIKYFLATENQSGTRLMQGMRRAKKGGETPPQFEDHFEAFSVALQKVLPHVLFTGVEAKQRTLLFDTTGLQLSFNQLSGGEREIAFLVGQIDRFGLRQGLFLLDEPELHLNADLIRAWVAYLMGTVETGQIWLATHSLEAVEAAGQQSTFVLERNETTRKVDRLSRLDTRPVLSALSRAVGTPAFSIAQLVFVFVEGEEGVGERERFRKLGGATANVRFMECGSCNEVIRRVDVIKSLARESQQDIRIGGVVDRDFRSGADTKHLGEQAGVFVLPVHEVENFFLHPPTLRALLEQNGRGEIDPLGLILDASDQRAGGWVFQYALATPNAKSLPEIPPEGKSRLKSVQWPQLQHSRDASIQSILIAVRYDPDNHEKLKKVFEVATNAYARQRASPDLWKVCEGKQILADIAGRVGFANAEALVQAAFAIWARSEALFPDELGQFRAYLAAL